MDSSDAHHQLYISSHLFNFSDASEDALTLNKSLTNDFQTTPNGSVDPFVQQFFFILPGVIGSIVCILGLLGNVLNIGVLSLAVRRTSKPTFHVLLVLAVANNMIMFIYLTFSLTFFARQPPIIRPHELPEDSPSFQVFFHSTWYLVINAFVCASNWFVVAATFFRFLAVRFPMKVGLWCTLGRVRCVILAIFMLSAAVVLPDALTIEMYHQEGVIRFRDTALYNDPVFVHVYYVITHVVIHLLPYGVNVVLAACLLRTLLQGHSTIRKTLRMHRSNSREDNNRRISIMLVVMVMFSLVTTLPSIIYIILRDFIGVRGANEGSPPYITLRGACDVIELLNYACHFYIYVACNSTYRDKFVRTMTCRETRASLRLDSQVSLRIARPPRKQPVLQKVSNDYGTTVAAACLVVTASQEAEESSHPIDIQGGS